MRLGAQWSLIELLQFFECSSRTIILNAERYLDYSGSVVEGPPSTTMFRPMIGRSLSRATAP